MERGSPHTPMARPLECSGMLMIALDGGLHECFPLFCVVRPSGASIGEQPAK